MFNPVTWDAHAFPVFFGGTTLNEDGTIAVVPSIQLVYFVTSDTKRQDARFVQMKNPKTNQTNKLNLNPQRSCLGRNIP